MTWSSSSICRSAARLLHPARDVQVGIGRPRISRGMIVDQNHGVGLPGQRGPQRLARMKQTLVQRPARHFLHRQHHVLRVQANDAHAFVIEQPHLVAEQARDVVRRSRSPAPPPRVRASRAANANAALSPIAFACPMPLIFASSPTGARLSASSEPKCAQQKFREIEHGPLAVCRCAKEWRAAPPSSTRSPHGSAIAPAAVPPAAFRASSRSYCQM